MPALSTRMILSRGKPHLANSSIFTKLGPTKIGLYRAHTAFLPVMKYTNARQAAVFSTVNASEILESRDKTPSRNRKMPSPASA